MKFYTNVQLVGDDFLVRGYDNGNYFQTREKFSPTLFMKSPKKSKYKLSLIHISEPTRLV